MGRAATVSGVEFEMFPRAALMVVLPVFKLRAAPEVLIVATAEFDEFQVAVPVRSWVLPSVNVPMATNCSVVASGIVGETGVTAIELRAGGVTLAFVDTAKTANVAVMVVFP